jgi:hypothetical protein
MGKHFSRTSQDDPTLSLLGKLISQTYATSRVTIAISNSSTIRVTSFIPEFVNQKSYSVVLKRQGAHDGDVKMAAIFWPLLVAM